MQYNIDELNQILVNHKLWFNSGGGKKAGLRSADFSNTNLSNANLCFTNLCYANLRFANLRHAKLHFADLRFADLSNADLHFADLSYANLHHADFSNAKFNNTTFNNEIINHAPIFIHNLNWPVIISDTRMSIGCQNHPIDDWNQFTNEQIDNMDSESLEFWNSNKESILKIANEHKRKCSLV